MPQSRAIFKKIFSIIAMGVLVLSLSALATPLQSAVAATTSTANDLGLNEVAYTGLSSTDIRITVAKIIRTALGLLGIVSLLLVLYGGFVFMTAGGSEEKVAQGKKILVNAGIGLVIILSSFGIVSFVLRGLISATTSDVGAGGNIGGGDGGGEGSFGQAFYISSLPQDGPVCIRNVHSQIVFNKEVDLSSVQDTILVLEKGTTTPAPGSWKYGATTNTIVFEPTGACTPFEGTDCFKANTDYTITFKNAANIKSQTIPALSLNCLLKAGCRTVEFKSGDGVDRTDPSISILYPANYATLEAGSIVPVNLIYTDDSGVQGVSLAMVNGANRELVNSLSIAGCKKRDMVTINWSTPANKLGNQIIEASATDWAGHSSKATSTVVLKPNHCFNGVVEGNLGEEKSGPPECGGECGACSGTVCANGTTCASGDCINGVCANVMRITGFSPSSGAPGTFVTVNGHYFGDTVGKVYFSTNNNPDVNNPAEWIRAELINCSGSVNNWSSGQVIVRVPVNATSSSHIKVESAPFIGAGGSQQTNVDTTKKQGLDPFEVNGLIRPNICTLSPVSGSPGDIVSVLGNAFGLIGLNSDNVTFGGVKALIAPNQSNQPIWSESRISVAVPTIGSGSVGVQVVKNNVGSNSVRFNVLGGSSVTAPFISEISPNKAPAGTYLTITGKNFGTQAGTVSFKTGQQDTTPIFGDTTFPKECAATFWSDEKIIVKFPLRTGIVGTSYVVQVNAGAKTSVFNAEKNIIVEAGDPAPGICAIKPTSGPVPFPAGQVVELFGEYFVTANNPTAAVYFWNIGALNPTSTDNRTAVTGAGVVKISANSATVVPPSSTISGPVSVYRSGDAKISNPAQFSAFDCRENTTQCGAGHCCLNGSQAGICSPAGVTCSNETVSAGYVWRFATRTIPPVPHVVERCDGSVDAAAALPSPSPSVAWDGNDLKGAQYNVCRTALVTIEFDATIDQSTVTSNSVTVNRCTAIEGTTCVNPTPVTLKPSSYKLETAFADNRGTHHYLSLQSADSWASGNWYQVTLSNTIKSSGQGVALAADKPCGVNGAYCFTFKGGDNACKLKSVSVTPYSYFTQILETPIRHHSLSSAGSPVDYIAGGLSDQRCIRMDVSLLPWKWETADQQYAIISGVNIGTVVNVGAKVNTVGVTPSNTVAIIANTTVNSTDGASIKSGSSPLTIDLTNPQVVEYWPKCLEACTNARVGVRFNVSMSTLHLDKNAIEKGSVQLLKCNDENCLSTSPVGNSNDIFLTSESNGTILEIANSSGAAIELEPNTIYKVALSTSSTSQNKASAVIWSRGQADDATSVSKPYNKEFTWRFKTKTTRCTINRAEVLPKEFVARLVNEKSVYVVQPYSAPDACSAQGQKLNPWSVAWNWTTSDPSVASIKMFTTRGNNQYCTNSCIKKGSDIPSTVVTRFSVCGNGVVEAGEDCEVPGKGHGCGLDCRWMGTTSTCGNNRIDPGEACDSSITGTIGCTAQCLRTGSVVKTSDQDINAAICGNGLVGQGEACDIGISGDVSLSSSSLYCTNSCLHTGTTLSADWCFDNKVSLGDFDQKQYQAACAKSYSRCGNGVDDPNEDPGCDSGGGRHASWCNDYCLADALDNRDTGCAQGTEGCSVKGQHIGSSLQYTSPSVCGDTKVETGEDAFCEENLTTTRGDLVDPWIVAIAQGRGTATGNPPEQKSVISAATNQQTQSGAVTGNALFSIACGYNNNKECSDITPGFGVGANTCCFARPTVINKLPLSNSTNVCRNTVIEATVNKLVNERTLSGNVLVARGITDGSACPEGTIDVSASLLATAPSIAPEQIWYKRLARFVGAIFASEVEAAFTPPSKWCAGGEQGASYVTVDAVNTSTSHIHVTLEHALATSSYYAVILKDDIKDQNGVSLSTTTVWKFETAAKICEVNAVTVNPTSWLFTKAKDIKALTAEAHTGSATGGAIQPIAGVYSWYYDWQPKDNAFVMLQNVTSSVNITTANNRNGEVDVRAIATVQDNSVSAATGTLANGSSHITVNLCESIWPPKRIEGSNNQIISAFPFKDAVGNTSGFSLASKTFNGSAIPPSTINRNLGDGYFNFSTYYCADSGSTGTFDDLPYLKPAIQTSAIDLSRENGSCEVTGKSCKIGDDCGTYYGGNGGFVIGSNATGICGGTDATGKVYSYFNSTSDPAGCVVSTDCNKADYIIWKDKNAYSPTCIAQPATNKRKLTCYVNAPLKRFIFTNTNNSDAVGIQIFANPEHLSPEQWYSNNKNAGGQGFVGNVQPVNIPAGYEAISDGNNVYVAALNYSNATKGLYSDIYLFSISQNAKSETRQVFEQLFGNLKFNTNITYNDGYCGASLANPSFITRCGSDLDCSNGQVCVNQIAKLKNNLQRYNDLKKIEGILDGYANQQNGYPAVNVGSFLPGQSLSSWDWAGLASVVGQGLPKDPVERLGKRGTCTKTPGKACSDDAICATLVLADTCTFHDPKTGWSTADRRFSFACATSSYAYRYQFSTSTGFAILNRFEDTGLVVSNTPDFLAGFHFNNVNRFKAVSGAQNSICNGDSEVTTISAGTCGDGQVNVAKGEQCDPAGTKVFNRDACTSDSSSDMTIKTCNAQCQWSAETQTPCVDRANCGNGKIDSGEQCDDGDPDRGGQNGKWNKCNADCTIKTLTNNGVGFCGDKVVNNKISNSAENYEVCDGGRIECDRANTLWTQVTSCGLDAVCEPRLVCSSQMVCKVDGAETTTSCTTDANCSSLQPNFVNKVSPFFLASVNTIVTSDARVTIGTLFADERLGGEVGTQSRCTLVGNSYTCTLRLSYVYVDYKIAQINFTFDPARCISGSACPTFITSITSVYDSCISNCLEPSMIKIDLKNKAVSCDFKAISSCTQQLFQCPTKEVAAGESIYGRTKEKSCSWDCQNYGPYCGDGVVQSANEECDWNAKDTLTCNVGGINGKRTCNSSCKFADSASVAWWAFDAQSGVVFADRNGTATGTCSLGSCPLYSATGGANGVGGTYRFTGKDVVIVADNAALMPTTTMSIEAWVKPEENTNLFTRVIEKGGYGIGGGYDLETNYEFNGNKLVAFNVWGDKIGNKNEQVTSTASLSVGTWTYIVATYEYQPTTKKESLKIYLNGILDKESVKTNVTAPMLTKNSALVAIGGRAAGSDYFIGSLNNVRVLSRVLQPSEIKDRFDNKMSPCTISAQSSVLTVAAGTCGDGQVDPSEVCDLGILQNGKQCTPGYAQTCQFCSADCKNTQNVRSEQFCGDGVIQGSEVCETDQATGIIYASVASQTSTLGFVSTTHNGYQVLQCNAEVKETGIFKKGTKTCSSDCKRLAVQETNSLACVRCGIDSVNGVSVAGSFINVLDPASTNPLAGSNGFALNWLAKGDNSGGIRLYDTADLYQAVVNGKMYQLIDSASGKKALFKPDQICSNNIGLSYHMNVTRQFDFPIKDKPTSWQYDLPISPLILKGVRDNDLRVVVSWVGDTDFAVGLSRIQSADSISVVEDGRLALKTATGANYHTKPSSDDASPSWNIWYHGQGKTAGGLTEEAFTINTAQMSTSSYKVYIRAMLLPIKNFRNASNLKVNVFIPEAVESYNDNIPSTLTYPQLPTRTFYFNQSDTSSSNANAAYWHVFTINRDGLTMVDKIRNAAEYIPNADGTATFNDNYPNGRIVTGVVDMH